jgi:hypothetical protein
MLAKRLARVPSRSLLLFKIDFIINVGNPLEKRKWRESLLFL